VQPVDLASLASTVVEVRTVQVVLRFVPPGIACAQGVRRRRQVPHSSRERSRTGKQFEEDRELRGHTRD